MMNRKLPCDYPCEGCDERKFCVEKGKSCKAWLEWLAKAWNEVVNPFREIKKKGGEQDDH